MASNSPIVKSAAARNEPWAVKLLSPGGWRTLSKAQKATARSHGIGAVPQSVVVPTTVRLIRGNPNNQRRSKGDGKPGNALKPTTITKGEYLGELPADSIIHSFILDPRNVKSFPTVSSLAQSYNKYRFTDFKVRYSPKVSDSECGLTIAYTSDASDPPPKGKFDLYSLATRFETAAHKPLLATIPISKTTKYARDCPSESSKDVDSGVVHILVDGGHDGRLGELFFEFTVVFSEPTFNQRSTQQVVGTATKAGPVYADITKSANTMSVTFRAAGNFLLTSHSSKLTKVGQLGMQTAEQKQTDSEESSSNIIEVVADKPGSSVIFYFADPLAMRLLAYITRL